MKIVVLLINELQTVNRIRRVREFEACANC